MAGDSGPKLPHVGRTRLIDVAELAQVTKSVASRVLNNDQTLSVREGTRLRVLESAQKLGYRPHAGARALAENKTHTIALLIPDLTNPVYSRITRGAYSQARTRGYSLLLAEDSPEEDVDEQFTELVASGRVDGLLIASARPNHPLQGVLSTANFPYVFVNRAVPSSGRNVTMDMGAASAIAVAHLVELGHRTIGHVSGPEELAPSQSRRAGLLAAAYKAGLPEPVIESGDFSERGGYEATIRLMRSRPDVTAIYTSILSQAIGTISALHFLGLDVPGQVSVVSYDDLPLAEFLIPALTTIAMPLDELGRAAVDAISAQLDGEKPSDVVIPTHPRVIQRSSTAVRRPM